MVEESKYKEEIDTQMAKAPGTEQRANTTQIVQAPQAPQMLQAPQLPQMVQEPFMHQMPQVPLMCCPYIMNMQCPMLPGQSMYGMGQPNMMNPGMYGQYGQYGQMGGFPY